VHLPLGPANEGQAVAFEQEGGFAERLYRRRVQASRGGAPGGSLLGSGDGHDVTGHLLAGSAPPKKQKPVVAWIEIHQEDLMADWELAGNGQNSPQ